MGRICPVTPSGAWVKVGLGIGLREECFYPCNQDNVSEIYARVFGQPVINFASHFKLPKHRSQNLSFEVTATTQGKRQNTGNVFKTAAQSLTMLR